MARYFTRPRSAPEGHWDDPLIPQLNVAEHLASDTGLVDKDGQRILRAPNPIGFTVKL